MRSLCHDLILIAGTPTGVLLIFGRPSCLKHPRLGPAGCRLTQSQRHCADQISLPDGLGSRVCFWGERAESFTVACMSCKAGERIAAKSTGMLAVAVTAEPMPQNMPGSRWGEWGGQTNPFLSPRIPPVLVSFSVQICQLSLRRVLSFSAPYTGFKLFSCSTAMLWYLWATGPLNQFAPVHDGGDGAPRSGGGVVRSLCRDGALLDEVVPGYLNPRP